MPFGSIKITWGISPQALFFITPWYLPHCNIRYSGLHFFHFIGSFIEIPITTNFSELLANSFNSGIAFRHRATPCCPKVNQMNFPFNFVVENPLFHHKFRAFLFKRICPQFFHYWTLVQRRLTGQRQNDTYN